MYFLADNVEGTAVSIQGATNAMYKCLKVEIKTYMKPISPRTVGT